MVVLLASVIPSANAISTITVRNQPISFAYDSSQEIVRSLLTNNSVIAAGQRDGKAEISARDFTGAIQWSFLPSNAVIASDVRAGDDGTYWALGAGEVFETKTSVVSQGAINPDSITVISPAPISRGLTQLFLWQISNSGALLNSIAISQTSVMFPRSLAVTKTGLVVVGSMQNQTGQVGAIWICSFTACNKPITVGKTSTILKDIALFGNDFYLVGESGETIGKLPLKGITDGLLLRIDKTGSIKSAIRSSLPNARRSWESITNGFLQGGFSVAKSGEATITQFSAKKFGQPIWSTRLPANSPAFTAGNGAVFVSTGAITQVKNWKPKAQLLLLTFDAKGSIKTGTSVINSGVPIWLSYLNGLGYGVMSSLSNTMCFTLIRE